MRNGKTIKKVDVNIKQSTKIIIFCMIFCILLSVSAVSAADNIAEDQISTDSADAVAITADGNNNDLSQSAENFLGSNSDTDILKTNNKNFTDLYNEINAGSSIITLTGDYYQYATGDKSSIDVTGKILDGNGATIDANNSANIHPFTSGGNVVFKNIKFININQTTALTNFQGGPVIFTANSNNVTFDKCNFERFTTTIGSTAGAIGISGGKNVIISNCNFYNIKYQNSLVIFYPTASENVTIENCRFKNTTANSNNGVYFSNMANGKIRNNEFINNTVKNEGLIRIGGSNNIIENNQFINTTITSGYLINIISGATNNIINNCNFTNSTGNRVIYVNGVNNKINNSNFINNNMNSNAAVVYWNAANGILTDCTFINNAQLGNEGIVYWSGASGLLKNCNFTANSVPVDRNIYKVGLGVVYWSGADGNLTSCNFNDNIAARGGAIYWTGANGNIKDSAFTSNSAVDGGAVFWTGANGNIKDSVFTSNSAVDGGAVFWTGANGNILYSNFTGNSAFNGAGIYSNGNYILINNSKFTGNDASMNGGAVYTLGLSTNITQCDFNGNTADYAGGVFLTGNSSKIINSSFTQNTAKSKGGAVLTTSSALLTNIIYNNNKASDNSIVFYPKTFTDLYNLISNGGNVDLNGDYYIYDPNTDSNVLGTNGIVVVSNTKINGNGAIINPGKAPRRIFYLNNVDDVTFVNLKVSGIDFIQDPYRGSFSSLNNASNIIFDNCDFINHRTYSNGGLGGIFYTLDSINFTISNCLFDNIYGDWSGGILYTSGIVSNLNLLNCNFTNSRSRDNGGVIELYTQGGLIDNCKFINVFAGNTGGAISISSSTNNIFSNCEFYNCTSGTYGGAIASRNSASRNNSIVDCTFTLCTSNSYGGAVAFNGESSSITNCIFDNNTAKTNGGAVTFAGKECSLTNCNFTNNTAVTSGGALYSSATGSTIENIHFDNNTAPLGKDLYASASGSITLLNFYTDEFYIKDDDGGQTSVKAAEGMSYDNPTEWSSDIYQYFKSDATITLYIVGSLTNFAKKTLNSNYNNVIIKAYNSTSGFYNLTHSVFDVSAEHVTIQDLTFQNITNAGGNGGVILVNSDNFQVINSTFKDNTANNGGALYLDENSNIFIVEDCTFINNNAVNGGALYIQNTNNSLIYKTNFKDNAATTNGGAIYYSSSVGFYYIDDQSNQTLSSIVKSNDLYKESYQTFACVDAVYVSITGAGSKDGFSRENATDSFINAFFMIAPGGTIYFVNSNEVWNFYEKYPDRIDWPYPQEFAKFGVTFIGNDTTLMGVQLIFDAQATEITISGFIFTNTSNAIVWNGNDGKIINCTFHDNTDTALTVTADNVKIKNCIFINNTGRNGGAINNTGNLTISNSQFKNNTATSNGGAIYNNGTLIINDKSEFIKNTATTLGGAIYVGSGNVIVTENNFVSNRANYGGAIYSSVALTLSDSNFTNNVANVDGGALYLTGSANILTNVQFKENTASSGSAIYLNDSKSIVLNNVDVDDNTHTVTNPDGGDIYIGDNADFNIPNNDLNLGIDQTIRLGSFNSEIIYVNVTAGKFAMGTMNDPISSLSEALNHIADGGKIIFLKNTYTINPVTISSLNNITIVGNGSTVKRNSGNYIFLVDGSSIAISDLTFDGGIQVNSGSSLDLTGVTFTSNGGSGIVYATGSTGSIKNSKFTSNTNLNHLITVDGAASISNSEFSDNSVTSGSVYYGSSASGTVSGSLFDNEAQLTKTGNINYGTDEAISVTFAAYIPSSLTIYLNDESKGTMTLSSKTFSKSVSLLPVGNYEMYFKDNNGNTYTFDDNSFTVNRLSTVYISPSGTGSGNSASSPTTWAKVADIITSTGTVVFATGDYSNFYGKTINQGWTLQAASGATPVLDANGKGRIFTISANNVKIDGLTFKNGKISGNQGSAISWTGTGGKISNSVFNENTGVPISSANDLTITNTQMKNQISLTKSNINWGATETIKATFSHSAPSTVTVLFNGASQGSYAVSSKVATAAVAFTNPSTQAVGSYVVTDLKNNHKEVL